MVTDVVRFPLAETITTCHGSIQGRTREECGGIAIADHFITMQLNYLFLFISSN